MNVERETIEYQGKNWHVVNRRTWPSGTVSVDLKPIPVLPPEPPLGTILVDDSEVSWQRYDDGWHNTLGCRLTWPELLNGTDLRNVMVAGKGTDSLVRLKNEGIEITSTDDWAREPSGVYFVEGFSDDEAPVHGYYKRTEQ